MRKFPLIVFALISLHASAQWTTNTLQNTDASTTSTGDCKTATTTTGKTWLAYFKNVPSPNNFEMRAQLLDKDGLKLLGPEGVLVNNAPHPTFTTIFGMAVDNSNNLIVGFANSSTNVIFINKIDTAGAQVWSSAGISFTNGLLPRLGILNNNDVVVSWLPATGTRALMQKLAAGTGATQWASPVNVEPAVATHRTVPANIFPLSGGDFIHLFHNRASTFGTASTLWAQRYNSSGVAQWAAPVQLCDKTTAYNREYFPAMHNDTLFIAYFAATGLRSDAFLQRVNPDGSRPWGMNGSDFALDNTYYEQDADMVIDASKNIVWAYSRLTTTSQSNQGTYVQKFDKSTGARLLSDYAKAVFPMVPAPYVVPAGISLFSDNSPLLLVGRYNSAVSQFLYATKLDDNGNFVWTGDTISLGKFPAGKARMVMTDVINDQSVIAWVERKGTFDQPYAQPIRIDGSTGLKAPVSSFAADKTTLCQNNPVQFTGTATGYITSYSWTFPGGSPSVSTDQNPVVAYNIAGTHTATLTVSNAGGSSQVSKTITVLALPAIDAGADKTIVNGNPVTVEGSGPASAASIAWTPAAGLSATNIYMPVANPSATTKYYLTVKGDNNCTAVDSATVTVLPYCVKVMDAFTPNGDGINDRWLVSNGTACIGQASVAVYNRYGQPVYKNDNYQNDWNGTYKGKPVADGTYYYSVSFRLVDGKLVTVKGNVTILR